MIGNSFSKVKRVMGDKREEGLDFQWVKIKSDMIGLIMRVPQ